MRRRFGMGFLAAALVVIVVGCQSGQPGGAAGGKWLSWWEALSVEEKLSHIQPYMVEGAFFPVSMLAKSFATCLPARRAPAVTDAWRAVWP